MPVTHRSCTCDGLEQPRAGSGSFLEKLTATLCAVPTTAAWPGLLVLVSLRRQTDFLLFKDNTQDWLRMGTPVFRKEHRWFTESVSRPGGTRHTGFSCLLAKWWEKRPVSKPCLLSGSRGLDYSFVLKCLCFISVLLLVFVLVQSSVFCCPVLTRWLFWKAVLSPKFSGKAACGFLVPVTLIVDSGEGRRVELDPRALWPQRPEK